MMRILIAASLLCLACGEPAASAPVRPASDPVADRPEVAAPAPSVVPETPPLEGLEGLEVPPDEAEVAPSAAIAEGAPDGAHTCVLASETRAVLEHAGRTAIAAGYLGQVFVASYVHEAEMESVAIVRVVPGREPELFTRIAIESPLAIAARGAAPGLAMHDGTLLLAAIDGRGQLLFAALDASVGGIAGRFTTTIDDAHADARFSPALTISEDGTRVIVWTDGSATPMRVRLARVGISSAVLSTAIISPDGGGAAPVFGLGERERAVYLVEARIAMSAAHRVRLGPDGTPAAVEVARPLLRGSDLPSIAVARAGEGTRVHLAYSAVGNLATRAIGLVQTTGTDSPLPLVAGVGYGGAVTVRAVPLAHSVVFAMEAPSAAEPSAPHEVRVRIAGDDGALGEPLVLPGQTSPDIALVSSDAATSLLAVGSDGARVTFIRCTE
jgi:hypothetical protein